MPCFKFSHVSIKGVAAAVPAQIRRNADYDWISMEERELLIKTTGIEKRHIAPDGMTCSDLCAAAAEQLITDIGWDKSEIDALIFVSQSMDYYLPATAIILQGKLGLSKSCMAFDVGLGCSGYVYGLSVISGLMQSGGIRKALLLVGDKSSVGSNVKDKSSYPLFGDAGTATALVYDEQASNIYFNLQSDGNEYKSIIIPHGGGRHHIDMSSFEEHEVEPGIIRHQRNLCLDGMAIFNFSLREVAPNVNAALSFANRSKEEIDYFVFHQANLIMNESVRKKLKVEKEKVPYSLADYGNTSSASIPITMIHCLSNTLRNGQNKLLLCGFGVGLSWGSVILETNNLTISEMQFL